MALQTFTCAITAAATLDCTARDIPVTVSYPTQTNANVIIYNSSMLPVADLKNAYHIRYKKQINKLWSASFYLPFNDIHSSKVTLRSYAELYDGDKRVGLFRIIDRRLRRLTTRTVYSYTCEHVLSTLNDSMLVGVHNSGTGNNTAAAINYVLGKQDTIRWKLGTCDWTRSFLYRWEDKSLLEALLEIPKRFGEDYQFSFSTTSYPWIINLISPSSTVTAYIDYGRNLQQISREEDTKDMYTRLTAWGQGVQGSVDQIDLSSANPTGKTYIDADTIGTYGVIARVWTDQRYSTSATLYTAAVQKLELRKDPLLRYTIKAADIFQLTGESIDNFALGNHVLITDEELDIDVSTRVVAIGKPDITGKPGSVTLQLANKLREFVDVSDIVYAMDLDSVKDGSAFARVLSTSIEAGVIKLSAVPGGTMGSFPSPPEIAGLYLGATHLGYHDGSNWKTFMDADGNFYLGGTGGSLRWNEALGTLNITGEVTATTGEIGGWIIGTHTLTADSGAVGLSSEATGGVDWRIWAGNATPASAPFRVDESGNMVASAATITGAITASSGTIGGFTIGASTLTAGAGGTAVGIAPATYPFYAGSATAASAPFRVSNAGAIVASSATITGSITISSGSGVGNLSDAGDLAERDTVNGTYIDANSIATGHIQANAVTATEINVTNLAAIKADLGSITAGNITLNTSGYIKGGASGYNSGTGFWMGYSSGYKFFIGNSAGNKLLWNGSSLAITGNMTCSGTSTWTGTSIGTTYTAAKCTDANADGTKTVIDGGLITTGYITLSTGGHIKGGATAYNTGTGFWMGYSSGYKFFIGTAAGNKLLWTGAALQITGAITATSGTIGGFTVSPTEGLYAGTGATRVQMKPGSGFWAGATAQGSAPFGVTQAGAVTCSNLTSTGGSITGMNIRTASSGARVQLTATSAWGGTQAVLEVYDATRVRSLMGAGYMQVWGSTGNTGAVLSAPTYGYLALYNSSGAARVLMDGDNSPLLHFYDTATISSATGYNLTIASGNYLLLTSAAGDDITLTSGDDIHLNVADASDILTIYDWDATKLYLRIGGAGKTITFD